MSELIKREDAINAVEMFFNDAYIEDAEVHDLVYKINHIPAASLWRRVEDELPRGQELVIVAVKDTAGDTPFWYTQCGWITTDGEYWIVDNEVCDYVVAWMPLPEPPKEDE